MSARTRKVTRALPPVRVKTPRKNPAALLVPLVLAEAVPTSGETVSTTTSPDGVHEPNDLDSKSSANIVQEEPSGGRSRGPSPRSPAPSPPPPSAPPPSPPPPSVRSAVPASGLQASPLSPSEDF